MKKRIICRAATLTVALAMLCGCTAQLPAGEEQATQTQEPIVLESAAPETSTAPEETTPVTAAKGTIAARLEKMTPIFDSIVRAIGIDGAYMYNPQDPTCFWTVLYMMGENYGTTHPLVELQGDTMVVPRKVMQEFATAAFCDYNDLLEIPETLRTKIQYDQSLDAYLLTPSILENTKTAVSYWCLLEDGTVSATVGLYRAEGELPALGEVRFLLKDNPYADGITEPIYRYSVMAAGTTTYYSSTWTQLDAQESTVDLNGDGQEEKVTLSVTQDDEVRIRIVYSEKTYEDTYAYLGAPKLYLSDMDVTDGHKELYLCGDTGSDDYETYIYSMNSSGIRKASVWGGVENVTSDGTITLSSQVDVLGTYGGVCTYKVDADWNFTHSTPYSVNQSLDAWKTRAVVTKLEALPVVYVASGISAALPAGTAMLLLMTDCQSYAVCELEDGQQIRITMERDPNGWPMRIQGAEEQTWFEELLYAG